MDVEWFRRVHSGVLMFYEVLREMRRKMERNNEFSLAFLLDESLCFICRKKTSLNHETHLLLRKIKVVLLTP